MPASDGRLVLHSSWRGLIGAVSSAVAMSAFAAVAWRGGVGPLSVGLTVAAAALVLVVLLDYPVATEFTSEGVVRRCLLRRQKLPWSRIDAITRTADSVATDTSVGDSRRRGRLRGRPSGLVAASGRRRYLLVNQCESRDECQALRDLMAESLVHTRWRAGLPDDGQPPTWLYRRRHWRP